MPRKVHFARRSERGMKAEGREEVENFLARGKACVPGGYAKKGCRCSGVLSPGQGQRRKEDNGALKTS